MACNTTYPAATLQVSADGIVVPVLTVFYIVHVPCEISVMESSFKSRKHAICITASFPVLHASFVPKAMEEAARVELVPHVKPEMMENVMFRPDLPG